jgi:hypothetical protein
VVAADVDEVRGERADHLAAVALPDDRRVEEQVDRRASGSPGRPPPRTARTRAAGPRSPAAARRRRRRRPRRTAKSLPGSRHQRRTSGSVCSPRSAAACRSATRSSVTRGPAMVCACSIRPSSRRDGCPAHPNIRRVCCRGRR